MKVVLKKLEHGKVELLCVRDDGSVSRGKGVPGMGEEAVPHDLIHLVVEDELGLSRGVFGLVMAGMEIEDLLAPDWKERFKARGEMEILLSEGITSVFQTDRIDAYAGAGSIRERVSALADAEGVKVDGLDDAVIARIRERIDELEGKWGEVPVGGKLEVEFPS